MAVCACFAAGALLYNIFASPDVLYDEVAYTWAAQHVALGWRLTLNNQQPLFVHPPLMFLLQAGWLRLTGQANAALPSAIHTARLLSASLGVGNVLLVAWLAYRLAGNAAPRQRRMVTGVVAALTAFDPVLVRYDRQDVIEPFALFISLLALHAAWALRDRGAFAYISATGLLGGLALLTNQITIALIVVPLLFALLERNGPLIRWSAAGLGIALAFFLTFFLWAVELGLAGPFVDVQTATLRRLIGLMQITGLNRPGVSLAGTLMRSVTQYSSSYVVLAVGFAALVWCWTRRNSPSGNFLTAWLTASFAFGTYIVAVGTLNEQFFVYLLPASIVGSVLLADALIIDWGRHIRRKMGRSHDARRRASRIPIGVGGAGCAAVMLLSTVSWAHNYSGPSDGVVRVSQFITTKLPRCAAVNVSGDVEKYAYLLKGRSLAYFANGAAALAYGVHYFILAPYDAVLRSGDMSPALASWIRDHGRRLETFPSQVYQTVQLWHVPARSYDPLADVIDIPGGVYVNTAGSHCGGYAVTNGNAGSFYSGYQALGGKGVVGPPLSRVTAQGRHGHRQFFAGVVLADRSTVGSAVRALPIVAMLAQTSPRAYSQAGFPQVVPHAKVSERRGWLTNPAIRNAYLDGKASSPDAYAAAVRRYGQPLGPPQASAKGGVSQPFAKVVLQASGKGGGVRAAAVTPVAIAAGVLKIPARARAPQAPPPLPGIPLGPPEPTSVEPFALTLGAALLLYGAAVAIAARRQRRARRAPAHESQAGEAA